MENIKNYRFFESDEEDADPVERLDTLIEYYKDEIVKFLDDRSMESDTVKVTEPDEFIIEY